ncbi:hypothetical protein CEXT_557241 [Caerostris extrusa]|uniref:Uncharacterized protein n=1 Tax=Caerostris extrusa TaxID=172846 RepID=A0AAV4M6R9_CAEEX|nr:hypothetical protein CEXT_557241 [Caerostris extrusa]
MQNNEKVHVDYELAVLAVDGSVLISRKEENHWLFYINISDFVLEDEVFNEKRSVYLPLDTHSPLQNMEERRRPFPVRTLLRQKFPVYRTSFSCLAVGKFSTIDSKDTKSIIVPSPFCGEPLLSMNLFFTKGMNAEELVQIEIIQTEAIVKLCFCKLSLLGVAGSPERSIKEKIFKTRVHRLPIFFLKEYHIGTQRPISTS